MSRVDDVKRGANTFAVANNNAHRVDPAECVADLIAAIRAETLENAALACEAAGAKLNSDIKHQIAGHFADAVRALKETT